MGTSTIYKKMNDLGLSFRNMNKKDLKELEKLSPWSKEQWYRGWSSPMELHTDNLDICLICSKFSVYIIRNESNLIYRIRYNGNIYVLVFWKGKLMKFEEAPKILNKKYYNKYRGKTLKEYGWTILKKMILGEIEYLDKEFKKEIRKKGKAK